MPHDGHTSHSIFDKNTNSNVKMISLRYDYFSALEEVARIGRKLVNKEGVVVIDHRQDFFEALTKLDELK